MYTCVCVHVCVKECGELKSMCDISTALFNYGGGFPH